ncbi:QcrA and Rieske domain-containing protein [Leptothoe spongobia]|uniref:Ubiquinol-cytochrome c reductase iron-sulfur subunit n=1 Tax=Leptothoe spongobia TAU-MAC 1115 TaxID=1967444 RepID=A0A947DE86_9CYAN|nr:ubiquinol-cytochrome c reductase iron-sulfur subunit [Leptothoe spongobia]MBT9315135.1 ubiquinol-cytochrome c reductase iron-sulfur subunit [Leptothoe spongobia TAU-MAC 1115]
MKRREFGNLVGLGLIATSLPVAIAACKSEDTISDTPADSTPEVPAVKIDETPRADGFAALGTVTDLDTKGYLGKKGFIAGPVIVIRDPDNADGVIALNSMCTHQGCGVEWKDNAFACPCHGSKFNIDGSVANGPATEPLAPYEAMIDGDLVLVKAIS